MKSGQIQYANGLSNLDVENLVKSDDFQRIRLEGAEKQLYVGSNVTAKPLDDVRVRQAIAYALDRDRVVAEVLRGSGYTASLPWPKYSLGLRRGLQQHATSATSSKAKKLIAEVGTIPTLPLTYTPTPIQEALAAIVQSNLGEVGIPIELDPVDGAQFVKELIGQQFKGLWIATHSWAQYTPSTLTVSAYPFNAHKNASRYDSKDYIAAADSAWETADGGSAEAIAAYQKVSEQLLSAAFLAEIAIYWEQWATSAKLQGAGYTKRSELLLTDAWLDLIMGRYLLRRLPSAIAVLFAASVLIFAILRVVPGDPASTLAGPDATPETIAAIRHDLGLDQPVITQYLSWLGHVLTFDLGRSYLIGGQIADLVTAGLTNTLVLTGAALLLAVVGSVVTALLWVGVPSRALDAALTGFNTVALALPTFVTGVILVLVFGLLLPILPTGGVPPNGFLADPDIAAQYLILPAVCLALPASAGSDPVPGREPADRAGGTVRDHGPRGRGEPAPVAGGPRAAGRAAHLPDRARDPGGVPARRCRAGRGGVQLARARAAGRPGHRPPGLPGGADPAAALGRRVRHHPAEHRPGARVPRPPGPHRRTDMSAVDVREETGAAVQRADRDPRGRAGVTPRSRADAGAGGRCCAVGAWSG